MRKEHKNHKTMAIEVLAIYSFVGHDISFITDN